MCITDKITETDELSINHKIRLSKRTFTKINLYARVVSELSGSPNEVMGILIGPIDGDGLVEDALLLPEQDVSHARARVPPGKIEKEYANAITNNYAIVGMWHSHASFSNFHSAYDDECLLTLLTYNTCAQRNTIKADKIKVPYAASIVINKDSYLLDEPCTRPVLFDNYYGCVAIRDGESRQILTNIEISLEGSAIPVDMEGLIDDVCRTVMHNGQYLSKRCSLGTQLEFPFMNTKKMLGNKAQNCVEYFGRWLQ